VIAETERPIAEAGAPEAGVPDRQAVTPSAPTPSRGTRRLPRRRLGRYATQMLSLVLLVAVGAVALRLRTPIRELEPIRIAPLVVLSPIRVKGVFVRAVPKPVAAARTSAPPRLGVPVPVSVTAYCLRGLTRRDTHVREGIVAADPRVFPLARYLEIYVGKKYWGRFLVDDTGGAIKGNKVDVWTPTCADARAFGRHRGTALLVPRLKGVPETVALTGRFGGAAR
jgi:3D (Asp-Asp-Asp) domain-containing protein